MDPDLEKKIDNVIQETNSKLEAIVTEMKLVKTSEIDDVEKRKKNDILRKEFEVVLLEQQEKVEAIMTAERM